MKPASASRRRQAIDAHSFAYALPYLALLLLLVLPLTAAAAAGSRNTVPLTAEWRFQRGDVAGAEAIDFADQDWTSVTLPHTFNSGDGEQPDYYRGPAWYRRAFEVRELRSGRRLFVQFDGAALRADVWVNGRYVGRHDGGHSAFRFDISPALRPGRNLLAVRVDNSKIPTIAPLGGDFTVFGGLYRPVSLVEVDAVHFDLLHHGGPGVYVRATDISPKSAAVAVNARIANDATVATRVSVIARILSSEGREVARSTRRVRVPAHSVQAAELRMSLPDPRFWGGTRNPSLYRLVASIGGDGDGIEVPLGIRSFRFDPQLGFVLNGRPYRIVGANLMHSARPGKGTAVTDAEIAEDFAILRELGSTGVRLVHFQHPAAAYEEADRLGLVTWTEIGINSAVEDTPEFRANAAQQLRELIAQNYNHPSVVMWGLGNEVYSEEPHVARILEELHDVAKAADPSRPTAYAHCCQADDHPKAMVTDLIGFNRYFGWYPDQKGTIGEWAERFHAERHKRPFAVSEYGAGASIVHQEDPPRAVVPASGWHPEQFQTLYHEKNWLELAGKPYLWGTFVWVAFDLASAGRHEGDRRGINDKGLVTYDRQTRKDVYYWYRANWSDTPMLYITSRRFTLRRQPDVEVKAYTNAGAATLLVNGEAVGTAEPQDRMLRWNVRLREGPNWIEVRSADGRLSDRVEWTYERPPKMVAGAR